MTDQAEQIAIALWHRFAPEGHMEWSEETHQAEYRDAADAVLLFTRVQPPRLFKLSDGCRTKADLYLQAHPEIPASFRVIADELDRIARTLPGITSASEEDASEIERLRAKARSYRETLERIVRNRDNKNWRKPEIIQEAEFALSFDKEKAE